MLAVSAGIVARFMVAIRLRTRTIRRFRVRIVIWP